MPFNLLGALKHPKSFIINSWRGYDWYDMDFGTGRKPLRVGIPAMTGFFVPRYCHIEECSAEGDVRLMLILSRRENEALIKYLDGVGIEYKRFDLRHA